MLLLKVQGEFVNNIFIISLIFFDILCLSLRFLVFMGEMYEV